MAVKQKSFEQRPRTNSGSDMRLQRTPERVRRLGVDDWRAGADDDHRNAADAVNRITTDDEAIDLLFKLAQRRATILVGHYWPEINTVAQHLLRAQKMTGEEVTTMVVDSIRKRGVGLRIW
jgi:hypothetical protein